MMCRFCEPRPEGDPIRQLLQVLPQKLGGIVVHLPVANVLVMGDLLTMDGYPVVGGTLRGMIEAIEGLMPLMNESTKIIPGRGDITDRDGVCWFLEMMRTCEARILHLWRANANAPEILDARPTWDFDACWGHGDVTGRHFTKMILAGLGALPS